MNNLKDLVDKFKAAKITLIGDIMLDQFVYGGVSRVSPEAPIPVLHASREEKMLGGAGNVFANLRAMGANVDVISVIGDDEPGAKITQKIKAASDMICGMVIDYSRPTVVKTRYLSQNQQLLRVDHESTAKLSSEVEKNILARAQISLNKSQVLILSDYGKGTLTPSLIKKLIAMAHKNHIPVLVDPKGNDFSIYKGATIVTPNKKELSEATNGGDVSNNNEVEKTAKALIKKSGIETVIATRSEDGMSVISRKETPVHLSTKAREVYDVSGAGDTVVAALAASVAAGGTYVQAAEIGNIAGGLAVAKVGTAIIRSEELLNALESDLPACTMIAPICNDNQAKERIQKWQVQGLKVGFTNGCFDILHYGHVNYLAQARKKCDRLVLALNHDASVRLLKGEGRPVNNQDARATVMAALSSVDLVVFFGAEKEGDDGTPSAILDVLKPDIMMKGGDYTVDQLPEAKVVLAYGGAVEIMPLYEGYSTTNIIEKSRESAA